MEKQQFCCEAAAARATKQLTLPDGFQVGIINMDTILREVAELNLTDTEALKMELLKRVKTYNYVASGAEYDYSTALFRAYQQQFEES
ncbi:hypothetical protein ACFLV6_03235 [Chloroflexota bacterium]